jgi:hypothetical protein
LPGGKAWAPRAKPRQIRATYTRPHGIRHLMAAYDVGQDRLYGRIKPQAARRLPGLLPLPATALPAQGRRRTRLGRGQQRRAGLHAVYGSWLNRIEAQCKALRYVCLKGTDHPDHATHARLIRRYIHWRNAHLHDPELHHIVRRANTANVA